MVTTPPPGTPRQSDCVDVDERIEAFETTRADGIKDTVRFVMDQNPGMTTDDAYASISELVATETERVKIMVAWDDEEMANLSNSVGACDAELTIEDMQKAMTEIAETCRVNREEAQAKADEAYLRMRMEPPTVAVHQTRRARELSSAVQHAHAAAKWSAAAATARCIAMSEDETRMIRFAPAFRSIGADAVVRTIRHAAAAMDLKISSPYRRAQRAARRVRMARKKRRGYA
jgi:hypothetical protein